MESTKTKLDTIPFTMVANVVLHDVNLSFRAKGLFAYIYSKKDGWEFSVIRIAKDTKDKPKAIHAGLKELVAQGYLQKKKLPSGKMLYFITYAPEEPVSPKGKEPKRQRAERGSISNTKLQSNKEELQSKNIIPAVNLPEPEKKELVSENTEAKKIFEILQEINKAIPYNHKVQWDSARWLVENHPKAVELAKLAVKLHGQPYAPIITTPLQLKTKLSQLEAFVASKSREQQSRRVLKI